MMYNMMPIDHFPDVEAVCWPEGLYGERAVLWLCYIWDVLQV